MSYLKLNEVFSDWATDGGIFTALQSLDVPWQDLNIAARLDLLYHGNHGDRIISPLVVKLLDDDNEISAANITKLANAIFTLYGTNWAKLYATLSFDYNPISNYDMTETETPAEITRTITPAETTETVTPAETTIDSLPAKTVTENEISGFDSDSYVDSGRVTVTGDSNEKGSEQLTVNTAGSNQLEVDSSGSEVITVQNERTLTRSGNIGITTSQQMVESERSLWRWKFFDHVFADLDDILTLKIY